MKLLIFVQAHGPCWENIGLKGLAKTDNSQRGPLRQDKTDIFLASSLQTWLTMKWVSF